MIDGSKKYSTNRNLIRKNQQEINKIIEEFNRKEGSFKSKLLQIKGDKQQGQGGLRTKGYYKYGEIIQENELSKDLNNRIYDYKPLVSIITVVYNGEDFLEQSILSVINQKYNNVEYIIIDGGSTDGTLEIIKKYENVIDYWISEPDDGIYDAMNKGITLCSGLYVGFVNADDILYEDTISELADASLLKSFDYTLGDVDLITKQGVVKEKMSYIKNFREERRYVYDTITSHQAFFISLKLLKKIGLFDNNYRIRADFEMMIRAVKQSNKFYIFKNTVAGFREGGASSGYLTFLENLKIMKKYEICLVKRYILTIISLIKIFMVRNLPNYIIKSLRRRFSSGRFQVIEK